MMQGQQHAKKQLSQGEQLQKPDSHWPSWAGACARYSIVKVEGMLWRVRKKTTTTTAHLATFGTDALFDGDDYGGKGR